MKKYTQGDEDGFYIPKTIAGVRIVSNRKKTATGYGKIDFIRYNVSAIIRKFIRENKLKEGDTLLPKV
jgi:hypothetical protein